MWTAILYLHNGIVFACVIKCRCKNEVPFIFKICQYSWSYIFRNSTFLKIKMKNLLYICM